MVVDRKQVEEAVRRIAIEKFNESIEKAGLMADPDCNKCYGRGYTGRDIHTNLMKPCRCFRRNTKQNDKRSGCSHGR